MKRINVRRQAGDTIVEVLIAIAIVSLVLAVSYATTTHNTRSIQDAQERSQAIQLAQRQIEFIKANKGSAAEISPGQNCFSAAGVGKTASGAPGTDECLVDASGNKVPNASYQPAYTIRITGGSATVYKVQIQWSSLLNTTTDNLTMFYRP